VCLPRRTRQTRRWAFQLSEHEYAAPNKGLVLQDPECVLFGTKTRERRPSGPYAALPHSDQSGRSVFKLIRICGLCTPTLLQRLLRSRSALGDRTPRRTADRGARPSSAAGILPAA